MASAPSGVHSQPISTVGTKPRSASRSIAARSRPSCRIFTSSSFRGSGKFHRNSGSRPLRPCRIGLTTWTKEAMSQRVPAPRAVRDRPRSPTRNAERHTAPTTGAIPTTLPGSAIALMYRAISDIVEPLQDRGWNHAAAQEASSRGRAAGYRHGATASPAVLASPGTGHAVRRPASPVAGVARPGGQPEIAPAHGRPYLMPPGERARIQALIQSEPWARAERERLRLAAQKGDGHAAAFLYASRVIPATCLRRASGSSSTVGRAGTSGSARWTLARTSSGAANPGSGTCTTRSTCAPLLAYDWVYSGLSTDERSIVESGILASARFRMRAMDRWSQTPNLVFKPTVMVAMAGLVTGNRELLDWGFHRKPGSARGGYFSALDVMLRDQGPWGEAPIYPIAHKDLLLMAQMSRYLHLRRRAGLVQPAHVQLGAAPRGSWTTTSTPPIRSSAPARAPVRSGSPPTATAPPARRATSSS